MRAGRGRTFVPLATTIGVFLLLYAAACLRYHERGFFTWPVFVSLFSENAVLGLAAIGVTFVILSGGIDLSVGAVVGMSSIAIARLLEAGWSPAPVFAAILLLGGTFGAAMGGIIHYFVLPPFLVTLAGMFLARGVGFVISQESVGITHPWYDWLSEIGALPWAGTSLHLPPATALILLAATILAAYVTRWTRFGRNVYALGGSETSALLMGLPVARTRILTYALSGVCAAAAGIVYTLYTFSGHATAGTMLELDAIAAAVIGGTLLTGGVGTILGTLVGVLIYGVLQIAVAFEGTLSSWWTKIAIGSLLLAFILMQRFVQQHLGRTTGSRQSHGSRASARGSSGAPPPA